MSPERRLGTYSREGVCASLAQRALQPARRLAATKLDGDYATTLPTEEEMPKQNDLHVFLGRLLAEARLKKGFKTIKEIYQMHAPIVDYQTWSCAESGRRIPHPNSLLEMARILDIDKEDLLVAYAKDKFRDEESHNILDTFPISKLVNLDTLLEATDHANRHDFIFTAEQVDAMRRDIRLRLFLLYTYDHEFKTTITRLATFFDCQRSEVQEITERLAALGLLEINGEEVKRIHRHTTLPSTAETFDLRRQSLFKTLERNVKSNSYIANCHVVLTEHSFKKMMELMYFTLANCIKLEKDDKPGQKSRYQIALVANRIDDGGCGDGGTK